MNNSTINNYNLTSVTNNYTFVDYDRTKEANWIVPLSVNVILNCFTFWILFSLVHYGRKTKKWRTILDTHSDKLNAGLVYSSVVLCSVLCAIRLLTNQAAMYVGFGANKDKECNVIGKALTITYIFLVHSTFLFLWLRQRIFYLNRMMNQTYGKIARGVSALSIFMIILPCVLSVVLYSLSDPFSSITRGCKQTIDDRASVNNLIVIVIVLLFMTHFTLFGLFIYPLQKGKNLKKSLFRFGCNTSTDRRDEEPSAGIDRTKDASKTAKLDHSDLSPESNTGTEVNGEIKQKNMVIDGPKVVAIAKPTTSIPVKRIMQRTLGFAIVSISADIFLLIFATIISSADDHRRFVDMAYDINSFLNLLFVILSFERYKEMLFSPFMTDGAM